MVADGGRGSVLEKNFYDFAPPHEGGVVKGGVAIAVGFFDVRIVLEKESDSFRMSVKSGAGEWRHPVFLVTAIDDVAHFEVTFHPGDAAAGDGTFEEITQLFGITIGRWFDVPGLVGNVKDEVVTDKSLGVLNLEKVKAIGWERLQGNGDGFGSAFLNRGWNATTVDNDVGVFGDMTGVESHGLIAIGEDGEDLME